VGFLDDLYRTSAVVRRTSRWSRQLPRSMQRIRATPDQFLRSPPVVANSVPKSGTHLLTQIVGALAVRDYGTFWTSVPSLPYRELPRGTMLRAVGRAVPGELVSAHLHFDPAFHDALERQNAVHVFIYRDPRDIVVSEAHYLTTVNTWHGLHRTFRALGSVEERVSLAIRGAGPGQRVTYPDVGTRFRRYAGWLREAGVLAVRFEDLVGERRNSTVQEIVRFYAQRSGRLAEVDELLERALAAIDPKRSFTFREGRSGGWRDVLSDAHKDQLKIVAGALLIELGYERDLLW
jgi:sulfotransferase 6B1